MASSRRYVKRARRWELANVPFALLSTSKTASPEPSQLPLVPGHRDLIGFPEGSQCARNTRNVWPTDGSLDLALNSQFHLSSEPEFVVSPSRSSPTVLSTFSWSLAFHGAP